MQLVIDVTFIWFTKSAYAAHEKLEMDGKAQRVAARALSPTGDN